MGGVDENTKAKTCHVSTFVVSDRVELGIRSPSLFEVTGAWGCLRVRGVGPLGTRSKEQSSNEQFAVSSIQPAAVDSNRQQTVTRILTLHFVPFGGMVADMYMEDEKGYFKK